MAGFASSAGPPLAGRWAPVEVKAPALATPVSAMHAPEVATEMAKSPAPVQPTPASPTPQSVALKLPDDDDLNALLASLGAEPPPVPPDETDASLDALLASLK